MVKKSVITLSDLSEEDFTYQDGKVHVVIPRYEYPLTLNTRNASPGSSDDLVDRRLAIVQNGLMFIHLDFTFRYHGVIATLPAECPAPTRLIEQMVADGVTVWIEAGKREVMMSNGTRGKRVIVNLVGTV